MERPSRSDAPRPAEAKDQTAKRGGSPVKEEDAKRRPLERTSSQDTRPYRPRPVIDPETDPKRLAARQKQIDYGKNTIGYQRYVDQIPKSKRRRGEPQTPDKQQKCSKRSWDGQIKKWRRLLHDWDPNGTPAPTDESLDGGEEEPEELPEAIPVSSSTTSAPVPTAPSSATAPASGSAAKAADAPPKRLVWSDIVDEEEEEEKDGKKGSVYADFDESGLI